MIIFELNKCPNISDGSLENNDVCMNACKVELLIVMIFFANLLSFFNFRNPVNAQLYLLEAERLVEYFKRNLYPAVFELVLTIFQLIKRLTP